MPLIKRSSKAARATNIRRLIDEGYPPRQAVAIGYSTQRAARARNRAGETLSTGPAYYEAARKKAVAWVSKNRPGLTGPAWYAAVRDAYHAILDRGGSNMAGGKRHNRAGKAPKAPRPPAGTPTSGNLYVLHTELEDHEKRNGQPQPLNAFGATSMPSIRRLLKAGYLAPAAGYPRGYWVTTGQGDSALHEWRIRHAGAYGIPANYGQNAAGGKRRNRAGVDVDTLARIARHARSVMREQFDGWVSLGKLRDPIGHAQVIRWLMERQNNRTDAAYKRNSERFGEREAAFRKGMADEAYDLLSDIMSRLDPAYVASLKESNKAGGKRRNRAGTRLTARKPSARSYAERLRSNADDFHHHRIDYETFSGRNKRIWSEVDAAGRATHESVLKLLREEAGKGPARR